MNTSNGCVYLVLDDRCQEKYDEIISFINYLDIYKDTKQILIDKFDEFIELLIVWHK